MAEIIAQELYEQEEDTQKGKYLTFLIGSETYAIEISYVTEIIGIQPITEVPEVPEYIRGIINLRGKIIPVMDVRLRFKKPFMEYAERTCVIVINVNEISIGLIVDSVAEVISIPDSDIVAPPEVGKGSSKFIKGIGKTGKDVILIMDCSMLLTEYDIEEIADMG
jgi:purine-binding chemotaxis protein CheW